MQGIDAYQLLMQTTKKVVITTHHHPDADALGSSLALARYLQKSNHQVQIITPSEYPNFLYWMNGNGEVLVYSEQTKNACKQFIDAADLIFCLDFSSYNRLQDLADLLKASPAKVFMIDHHLNPEIKPNFMFWDKEASATAELVYELIELLGDLQKIDVRIGECLYAGIVTDTSSFKHPSTTPKAHEISASLIKLGVDTNKVHRLIYDSNTKERIHFLGYALQEKLKILPEYRTAYFVITLQELKDFNTQMGDTEGLVNYAISLADIDLAALIVERVDCVKISFRSVGNLAVNELAEKHFYGGGHKNAAGGSCNLSVAEVEQKLLNLLPNLDLSI